MSIRLGNTTASLYLGSTPVAAYLGAQQVYSAVQAVTLYFEAAEGGEWNEADNWWLDDDHTIPAGRIPTASDSVYFSEMGGPFQNSGDPAVVVNLTAVSLILGGFSITVTGEATFSGTAILGDSEGIGEIIGNVTFNGGSQNQGIVTGNATFNDTSSNLGIVTGNATFNDTSSNLGIVTGNATFNDTSSNLSIVTGTATFTGSACNDGGTAGTFVPDPPPSCP
jgi:hypothetical protein